MPKKIIIVGGGLVGALQACFLAKRGYDVELHEFRQDIREKDAPAGRSINLALSCRGLEALGRVGLDQMMKDNGIPMYARMIHDLDGTRRPIPYGKSGQHIMSVDRKRLNQLMLSATEKFPGVKLFFRHRCVRCNIEEGEVVFANEDGSEVTVKGDLIIGCDGAFSTVRRQLMRATRVNFSQKYIPHGYMELRIPPTKDNQFMMETNYLHIWPRHTFMMIGLPNVEDSSFVITLFMPFAVFDSLTDEEKLLQFFEKEFPDSLDLIGREELVKTFFSRQALPLLTVKCFPYHFDEKCVIMGDAAHAMVPFYGQGMNCGFEDCVLLDDLLDKHNENWGAALEAYSNHRNPDAEAMCDLALGNYIEMRSSVNTWSYLLRKKVDGFLNIFFPKSWIPLYSMVSFTRTRYHHCIEYRKWQDKVLKRAGLVFLTASLTAGVVGARQYGDSTVVNQLRQLVLNNRVADVLPKLW